MTYSNFTTTTFGKWILVGEHAVIRGHGALVFPIGEKKLTLNYQPGAANLSAHFEGESAADTHLLFWSVLEHGLQLLNYSLNHVNGHFTLTSNIPVGVGMGASAALCVAMARWFDAQHLLVNISINEFARQLENLFHGQSSGLDIMGVAAPSGVYYAAGQGTPLNLQWQPCWLLTSCGQIGITSHCIQQVQTLWDKNPEAAAALDQQMAASTAQARNALEKKTSDSFSQLAEAISLAKNCFQQWGLISESLQHHMQILLDLGARAVKPTGSGGGGFVVSLWEKYPTQLPVEMISINTDET